VRWNLTEVMWEPNLVLSGWVGGWVCKYGESPVCISNQQRVGSKAWTRTGVSVCVSTGWLVHDSICKYGESPFCIFDSLRGGIQLASP